MIFATTNKGKLKQLKNLVGAKIKIEGLNERGLNVDIEEDGRTFEENAIKKATVIHKLTGEAVLADDSGLCIDYFDGWPGVYTHRFLPNSTAEERNDAIIEKMQNVSDGLRGAAHVCVLALCDKNGLVRTYKGEVRCTIAHKQKGDNLFGFDPIALLPCGKTLAELSDEEKVNVNARGIAFKKLIDDLENIKDLY